ncbi:DNA polymerase III subunit chi [Martelella sp. HB161492]|uniref:DNA polymerase III subunit chi n=1 Tax=Martelella sp. HB161492 TaxID=2720726 RepID=UPI0015914C40
MTEVLFYHLTEARCDDALPPLVEKSLERGWRIGLKLKDEESCAHFDGLLWTYSDTSFLPHGRDDEADGAEQPILLTTGSENRNGADIRFFVGGAPVDAVEGYKRVVVMFDGHDNDELALARSEWKRLRGEGHALTYWQQGMDGRWSKKS